MIVPRGIRNNNPGNIEKGGPWKGTENVPQTDERFATFLKPEYGIRAIARLLMTYQNKHQLDSIDAMINRWAPNFENNTNRYIEYVASVAGVGRYDKIDVRDFDILKKIVKAIIKHENGQQPYDDSTIIAGLALAGVTPEDSHLTVTTDKQYKKQRNKEKAGLAATATGGTGVVVGSIAIVEKVDRAHAILSDKSLIFIGFCATLCFGLLLYQNHEELGDWIKTLFIGKNYD